MYYIEQRTNTRNIGRARGEPYRELGEWERIDCGYNLKADALEDIQTLKMGESLEDFVRFEYQTVFVSE